MLLRLSIAGALVAIAAAAQESTSDRFEKKIRPVLAQRCYQCHSSSAAAPQGGLRLDSAGGIRRGGNSGVVIRPGNPESSLIIRAIRYQDKNLKMPPGGALPPEIVADFEAWIRDGASLPQDRAPSTTRQSKLWSLKAPARSVLPIVTAKWGRNEIDLFILSKLEAKGLAPSPEGDRSTLIRRASYDLTGLPPSAGDIDAFAKDTAPDAYEKLIDRLLASPRYGERWGRHWLDVARYADSVNDSVNSGQRYPWSYTYRDWVIRSFNDDLPYDRFVLYQIAADRVSGIEQRHLAALGFLSLGREFPKSYPETVDDRIDAVSRGFLGLTVACARCHDHKFDPIPTQDYYSLYSILSNIRQPQVFPLLGPAGVPSPRQELYQTRLSRIEKEYQAYRIRRNNEMVAFFKTQTADYLMAAHDSESMGNTEIEDLVRDRQLNQRVLERWRKYLRESKSSGEPVFRLWHAAAAIPPDQFAARWPSVRDTERLSGPLEAELSVRRIETLSDLATNYAAMLMKYDRAEPFGESERDRLRAVLRGPGAPANIPVDEFELIYTEGDSNNTRSIRVRHNAMLAQAAYDGSAPRAMAVEDVPSPVPGHVFIRGNPNNPGALAPARFLSCLSGENKVFRNGSGRLDLAEAIIDPSNPLTARVIVNRVWMHHFGFGLARTPSDFGFRGDPPTHPELLDYLAVKLVESGWSLKKLHRLIMTSAAYRQASTDNEAARKIDPENQLLWRMNRRRLEIEAVRDSMLVAAGRLDLTAGGIPFLITAQPSTPRRSVYGFIERGRVPAVWAAFDFASPDQHAPQRFVTTVPQQALFFLNSPFIAEQAAALAARVEVAAAPSPSAKIEQMYRLVFGRSPQRRELEAGLHFVSEGAVNSEEQGATSAWQYGTGLYDDAEGRVTSFTRFTTFVTDSWQGGASLPSPRGGKAVLRAAGGEPGEQPGEAVVRRWVSPISGTLSIEGTLRHGQPAVPYGDGVRGRIVSSRHGELASWSLNGSSAETRLGGLKIEKGDTVDFIVDARLDPENDAFSWAPIIKVGSSVWNAKSDFTGPVAHPLSVWARFGQVLFETNEFSFVD
jgi:hypothetical protein